MKNNFFLMLLAVIAICSKSVFSFAETHTLLEENKAIHNSQNQSSFKRALQLKRNGKNNEAMQTFISITQQQPDNAAAFEQLAIIQSWKNEFDLAIGNFKKSLIIDKDYTPARIGLARVSYWQGERNIALTEINQVIHEQPKITSNWILKGDILMADAKPIQAREAYLQAQILLGTKKDYNLSKKINNAKSPKKWRLDTGYISDSFTQERVDGHSSYLQLAYTLDNAATLYARGEKYFSFDTTDTGIVVGAYFFPHKILLLNTEYYRNHNEANFRPNEQISINADFVLSPVWQPLLSFRTAIYNVEEGGEGTSSTITPGLRFNYNNASIEYRHARSNNADDTITSTNTFKINLNYKNVSPYIVYTQGEEGIPPLDTAEISVLGLGAVFKLSDSMGFRIDVSREDRKDTYIHNTLGAGVSVYF
jgi:YaiO family outer membrane protein